MASHSRGNESYLKLFAHIPALIEDSVFIAEEPAYKENAKYTAYRYYAARIAFDGKDKQEYFVKIVAGRDVNGLWYYDQYLTEVQKLDPSTATAISDHGPQTGGQSIKSLADFFDFVNRREKISGILLQERKFSHTYL
jgi:hypothetical protein